VFECSAACHNASKQPIPFKPDLYVEDGDDLSVYGFNTKVLHRPGCLKGSVGILTASGDLFCGDLMWKMDQPAPSANIDDSADLNASLEKPKSLTIGTVYPGHGKPFPMEQFMKNIRSIQLAFRLARQFGVSIEELFIYSDEEDCNA
jgi:glyoxylase-like metal-dependent hydrolase (beta-lactamase superfamily II)